MSRGSRDNGARVRYLLDEVEDYMFDFPALVPVRRNSEERDDIGARPAVHANVDLAWQVLKTGRRLGVSLART